GGGASPGIAGEERWRLRHRSAPEHHRVSGRHRGDHAMSRPRLILIGPPGAGKPSVGRLLAEFWQVTYRDTDADIEYTEGRPIADIFLDEGEEYFRRQEHAAVLRALSGHDGVLALGGGAVMDPATQEE